MIEVIENVTKTLIERGIIGPQGPQGIPGSAGSLPVTSNLLKGNGVGGAADSLIAPGNVVVKQVAFATPHTINDIIACLQAAGLCAAIMFFFGIASAFSTNFGDIDRATNINTLSDSILNLSTIGFVKRSGANNYVTAASAGATPTYTVNVKDAPYNAAGDGATDDSAAINSAILAVFNAHGGVVFFPRGTYLVNGAFDGTTNSILKIPFNALTSPSVGLTLAGEGPAPGYGLSSSTPTSGTIIKSTKAGTGTQPAMLAAAAPNANPANSDFNNVYLFIKDMIWETYDNPTINCLRLEVCGGVDLDNLRVDTYPPPSPPSGICTEPSHSTTGVWMPSTNNLNLSRAKNVAVNGYDTGWRVAEHFLASDAAVSFCHVGFLLQGGNEAITGHIKTFRCTTSVSCTGNFAFDLLLDLEYSALGGWYDTPAGQDFSDSASGAHGTIRFNRVKSNVGPQAGPLSVTNAFNVRFLNLLSPLDQVGDFRWNFVDPADQTKKFQFIMSGITTATTRTVTLPDANITMVGTSNTQTLSSKRITPRIGTETSSATSTPTADTIDEWNVTALAVADAFAAPTGAPVDGQKLIIRIKDAGAAKALTWNAIYRASSDLALPSTTILSKTLYLGFIYNAADSKWDLLALLNNF